tara:strand:- start:71 stop:400 length:330 start_codon:yes stop_codon:yes gene_type:complete
MSEEGQLQNYSVDQAAGAIVLVLGAVASLLLVIWQSKCHCKMNLCYIFQCERRPPSEEEMAGLKDQAEKLKDKKNNTSKPPINKKKDPEDPSPRGEPEPEPEPEIEKLM